MTSADDDNKEFTNPYQQPPGGGTPPQPPFAAGMSEDEIDNALERNRPAVASGGARLIVYAFIALLVVVTFLYFMLYSGGNKDQQKPKDVIQATAPSGVITPPALPPTPIEPTTPPPPPIAPPEPPQPPPPPIPPTISGDNSSSGSSTDNSSNVLPPVTSGKIINFDDKEMQKRLRSNMMVMEDAKGVHDAQTSASKKAEDALNSTDTNRSFASEVIDKQTEKTSATKLLNLDRTIAQGKIIEAVLESAINTDLPTPIRAIVSRDVYAESGRRVMIPKGSRMIGEYNTDVFRGQARVFIVWTRVLEPDGTDVAIGSPGIDSLGRAGVGAHVDNKFMNLFSTALLNTVLNIGTAVAVNGVAHGNQTTTTASPNGTTTTGSAGAIAAGSSIQQFSTATQGILQDLIDLRPTLTIDQGTRVNVFVNRDVYFPESGGSAVFVQ